jgi:hypothetical protein
VAARRAARLERDEFSHSQGQSRRFGYVHLRSALSPGSDRISDIAEGPSVPDSDIDRALFDHLVGARYWSPLYARQLFEVA